MTIDIKDRMYFQSFDEMVNELNIKIDIAFKHDASDLSKIECILNNLEPFKDKKYCVFYNCTEEIFEIYELDC